MPNAYNTPAYRAYIATYNADLAAFSLVEEETETLALHDLTATWTTRDYEMTVTAPRPDGTLDTYRAACDTALFSIRAADGHDYTFDCIDHPLCPIPLTLGDRKCILLRRALYGYTLLDTADLAHPTLDYFPASVLDGDEAFIISNAYPLGSLMVLEGCYWACSRLDIFILDPATARTLHLNKAADFEDIADGSITTTSDTLTLLTQTLDADENTPPISRTFSLAEIQNLLATQGTFDL